MRVLAVKRKSEQETIYEPIRPGAPETLNKELKRKSTLRVILTEPYRVDIDLDYTMWRHSRNHLSTLKENELWLAWLAEESGGSMLLPHSTEELPRLTDDLPREIDSQYIVTYRPKLTFSLKSAAELRHVEVVSRRVGPHVYSRRSYGTRLKFTVTNERLLGAALKSKRRQDVIIATKFGWRFGPSGEHLGLESSPVHIKRTIEGSLKRLNTDYLNLYYQHRLDPNTRIV